LTTLRIVSCVANYQGDYASARILHDESLAMHRELGDRYGIAYLLELFASLALKKARSERAAQLWGAVSAQREAIGAPLPPGGLQKQAQEIAAAREALGANAFTGAWEEGCAMTMDQAIECALDQAALSPPG
jgi:hypothetical protein